MTATTSQRRTAEFEQSLSEFVAGLSDSDQGRWLAGVLLRRWQSSLLSAELSLRRLLTRADVEASAMPMAAPDPEDTADPPTPSRGELPIFSSAAVEGLLARLDYLTVDSKWAAARETLQSVLQGPQAPIVVFTDYSDTAEYVAEMARQEQWRVGVITGRYTPHERADALRVVETPPSILVLTTAASEGMSLTPSSVALHYDIPWNPMRLLQRYGRLERIGQVEQVYHHLLVSDGTCQPPLDDVLEKIRQIDQAFDA